MKTDKSLEDAKFLTLAIYALVFVALCGLLIIFLLLPLVNKHKIVASNLASQNLINQSIQNVLNQSQAMLDELISENNQTLTHFDTAFKKERFVEFAGDFFEVVQLEEQNITQTEPYLKALFHLKAKIKTPNDLYAFIEALNEYDNVIKIVFPFELKINQDKIDMDLNFKVYSSK
ncbi:hypothetical protein DMB92_08330 [Campylobacter sp. MIT 99-7217]|uniref:hypothetical protein n=1 Tax=Campylobacter sp. MIT 99-7217 TaxID=535091 RepID=UPI0011573E6E|nr:hypothetical protein [Campylobacter sp. MIT 99-7217]TQR29359.1 hypothetical protein DMB92_08330 [Campylobacter sp. MIT 99-7217]